MVVLAPDWSNMKTYYKASEGKVYKNRENCADCELMQINSVHTDKCGGIEVADGDETEGGQYR